MVRQAAQLIGLDFTPAEIDSLLPNLTQNRQSYQQLRQENLPNHLAPALQFSPLLPGQTLPARREPFEPGPVGKVNRPANRDELAFYSVRQLAELLRTRQITSAELTEFFLARLRQHGPALACVVTLTDSLARQQARQADQEIAAGRYRGLLHGIPFGVKDLLATRGYKTTWGSAAYRDQMIDLDATVVTRLREAGAVLLAKLSLGELAMGDVWFGGTTRNPWAPAQGSSGSSAGSASAVAAGLLPFAIGTETLGSIVSPGTVCGVTGLRPTFGRVSRHGAMTLVWSMDKIGPMARTVEDCALVFQAIHGPDGQDPTVVDAPFNYRPARLDVKKLRIGYLHRDFARNYAFKQQDSLALAQMRAWGWQLVPLELPEFPVRSLRFIIDVEAAAAFDELTRSGRDELLVRQTQNAWPNIFRDGRLVPAVEYLQANRVRTRLMQQMAEKLKTVDVYVAPSWTGSNLTLTNLTGHPCVVLPNGFGPQGTPTSLTFVGQLFGEAELLAVAGAYQAATRFHQRHPAGF
jgi:Asp-tRNA(Asn)/Glu-tRNA(Gln) amidotransferase A subunit family amidase